MRGKLNIGFGISTYREAPRYISEFKHLFPEVNVTLNDIPSSQQRKALLSGDLQLSFSRLQDIDTPLQSIKLFPDRLAIAVHEREDIDIDNLWGSVSSLDYLQLKPDRGIGLYRQIQRYLTSVSQSPIVIQEANDILTLLALVSARLGYTIIPASAQTICPPNVSLFELTSRDTCWDIGLIWNRDNVDQLTQNFIDLVKQRSDFSHVWIDDRQLREH
ncbi:LysR family substrate-binding domain-containing protein [Vibrio sp. PP-XX7]